MADKKTKAAPVPSTETFSFEDYLTGKSTFPGFDHTVYLDQAGGVALQRLIDEYDRHAQRGREIQARQAIMNQNPTTVGLVDDDFDELNVEFAEIVTKTDALEVQITAAEERIKDSALKLFFQASTPHHLGQVVRRAEKEFDKVNGRKPDDDLEYATAKSRYLMAAQLAAFCVKVEAANGTAIPVPGRDGFISLLDRLISSETIRLFTAFNQGLETSAEWAKRLDAGFPGGGADVADEPMGAADSEGGPELGRAADDDDDRGEDLVA